MANFLRIAGGTGGLGGVGAGRLGGARCRKNERNEEGGLAMVFSEDEMRDEACFWAAVDVAGRMRDEGVVTEEEYLKVVRMLLEEFPAVIGGLFYGE